MTSQHYRILLMTWFLWSRVFTLKKFRQIYACHNFVASHFDILVLSAIFHFLFFLAAVITKFRNQMSMIHESMEKTSMIWNIVLCHLYWSSMFPSKTSMFFPKYHQRNITVSEITTVKKIMIINVCIGISRFRHFCIDVASLFLK